MTVPAVWLVLPASQHSLSTNKLPGAVPSGSIYRPYRATIFYPSMTFDLIITGAGAAGLSLLHHMLHSSWQHKNILLIDSQSKTSNDRTWCFWDTQKPRYAAAQKTSWQTLQVSDHDFDFTQTLQQYTYYHINSIDFYEEVRAEINTRHNVYLVKDTVTDIKERDGFVEVKTSNKQYKTSYVFNSIPNLLGPRTRHTYTQNFLGWRVRTKQPVFNPAVATLMDFSTVPHDLSAFYYILPFSENEALVEFTQFSQTVGTVSFFTQHLQQYMAGVIGSHDYEILETEKGVIPMSNFSFDPRPAERVFQIGTAGGDTKASTGYTFNNIQKHCAQIVAHLTEGKAMPGKASRFAFYDGLLLQIMMEKPHMVRPIMKTLFANNGYEKVLHFLDEGTQLHEEASIFLKLPWAPFLKALISKKHQLYEPAQQSNHHLTQPAAVALVK